MGETTNSNSTGKMIVKDDFETQTLSLPWYSSPTNRGQVSPSGYEENLSLPWYSDLSNRGQVSGSGYEENLSLPWYSNQSNRCQVSGSGSKEASTSAISRINLISHFVGMGFRKKMVRKAIKENGESNTEILLETLLTYSALTEDPLECETVPCDQHSSESEQENFVYLSDSDSCLENEEDAEHLQDKDKKLLHLTEMGFSVDEASSAIGASGPCASVLELMDFIYAAQAEKTADTPEEPPKPLSGEVEIGQMDYDRYPCAVKKRKQPFKEEELWRKKVESWRNGGSIVSRKKKKRIVIRKEEVRVQVPKHMIGFGVPNDVNPMFSRKLLEEAVGPPYFYYENVACTPKGAWDTISRFLSEVEPEFVDSKHFCSAARKRGYVHNLPTHNRYPLHPIPPLTIQEALPMSKKWWPSWDERRKLNCLSTCIASAKLTQRLRDALEAWDDTPPLETRKYVLYQCKKWNLVWTGKNKLAPLEPDEMEMILGYPKDHTRSGISRTDRYKSLGNSFQVDTVAYHFSALKSLFPNGITVLSLFSGIGGAEVALHRLGIPLKAVVSVEILEVNRSILRSWWEETNQCGKLIEYEDVQELSQDTVESLVKSLGGFDLVVGGSPCNNLTGSNRWTRDGLDGEHSTLFYDFFRILNIVKLLMQNK